MYETFSAFLFRTIKMAIVHGLFSCFSGSSKVDVEEREAHNVDGDHEANKSRKGAAIPVTYFPVNFNRLCL